MKLRPRFLRSAEDSSPGGGAPPPAAQDTTGDGDGHDGSVTFSAAQLKQLEDSIFAKARRTFETKAETAPRRRNPRQESTPQESPSDARRRQAAERYLAHYDSQVETGAARGVVTERLREIRIKPERGAAPAQAAPARSPMEMLAEMMLTERAEAMQEQRSKREDDRARVALEAESPKARIDGAVQAAAKAKGGRLTPDEIRAAATEALKGVSAAKMFGSKR